MATPAYPGAVKTFGADLENLVNIVYAAHVNDLRAEVVAVETEIGLGLRKSITWANRPAFDRPTSANFTWGDLSLRLTNIEAGLVSTATDIHPQYFLTTGGSLTGPINMGGNRISNLGNGTVSQDAVNLGQLNSVSTVANAALPQAGGHISGILTMGNNIVMGSNRITQLPTGASPGDAVNKSQLDAVANAALAALAPLLTPPSFEGVRTSTSTRTSSPWTINYTAETDPLGMLDTSTGGATLTAGLWLVAGHAAVTMAADSSAVQLIVMKDGVEGAANKTQLVNAGDYGSLAVSEVVRVTSTMSVWLSAVARSGITWYVNQAKFSVVKLGEL